MLPSPRPIGGEGLGVRGSLLVAIVQTVYRELPATSIGTSWWRVLNSSAGRADRTALPGESERSAAFR
jgi:hypothetical protein